MKVVKYHVSSNIMFVIKDVRLRNGISLSLCKKKYDSVSERVNGEHKSSRILYHITQQQLKSKNFI